MIASDTGHEKIVDLLLRHGAEVDLLDFVSNNLRCCIDTMLAPRGNLMN